MTQATDDVPPPVVKRLGAVGIKVIGWLAIVVVLGALVSTLWNLWHSESLKGRRIGWGWLVLASLAATLAWGPAFFFWKKLLERCGARVAIWPLWHAYFAGHLGKYVPGKAAALVIRAVLLRRLGVSTPVTLVTTTLEALVTMGVGVAVCLVLGPWAIPAEQLGPWRGYIPTTTTQKLLASAFWLLTSVSVLWAMSGVVIRWLTRRAAKPMQLPDDADGSGQPDKPVPAVRLAPFTWSECLLIVLAISGVWWGQGLCLGFTLRALEAPHAGFSDWPMWTVVASLSLVSGFLALFTPGGLVVREGAIVMVLAPVVGNSVALAAAVLSRLAMLVGEAAATGLAYLITHRTRSKPMA